MPKTLSSGDLLSSAYPKSGTDFSRIILGFTRWVILRMCRNGTGATLSDKEHIARPAWAHAEEEPDGDLQNRPLRIVQRTQAKEISKLF